MKFKQQNVPLKLHALQAVPIRSYLTCGLAPLDSTCKHTSYGNAKQNSHDRVLTMREREGAKKLR